MQLNQSVIALNKSECHVHTHTHKYNKDIIFFSLKKAAITMGLLWQMKVIERTNVDLIQVKFNIFF